MKDYVNAIKDVESILLNFIPNPHYQLVKLRIVGEYFRDEKNNEELFHYMKSSIDFLKENLFALTKDDQTILD